jgi:hypothetical protein
MATRLLMVLAAMAALCGIAGADMVGYPASVAACLDKVAGSACTLNGSKGVCLPKEGKGRLWCHVKDDMKKEPSRRSTLGVLLLVLSAGSLETLRRKRRPPSDRQPERRE